MVLFFKYLIYCIKLTMGWGGIRKNLMSRIRDFFSVDSFWDDHFEKHGRFLGIILIIGSCLAFPILLLLSPFLLFSGCILYILCLAVQFSIILIGITIDFLRLPFSANRRWAYTFWTLDNCFGIETSVEDYEHWKATLKL
jgi:hypothetical protein